MLRSHVCGETAARGSTRIRLSSTPVTESSRASLSSDSADFLNMVCFCTSYSARARCMAPRTSACFASWRSIEFWLVQDKFTVRRRSRLSTVSSADFRPSVSATCVAVSRHSWRALQLNCTHEFFFVTPIFSRFPHQPATSLDAFWLCFELFSLLGK